MSKEVIKDEKQMTSGERYIAARKKKTLIAVLCFVAAIVAIIVSVVLLTGGKDSGVKSIDVYVLNDSGTRESLGVYEENSNKTITAPKKAGYDFDGWLGSDSVIYHNLEAAVKAGVSNVVANYKAKTYTIYLYTDGGIIYDYTNYTYHDADPNNDFGAYYTRDFNVESGIIKLPTNEGSVTNLEVQKTGTYFVSWKKEKTATVANIDCSTTLDNIRVWATWATNAYSFKIMSVDKTTIARSFTFAEGANIEIGDYVCSQDGYEFLGYYSDEACTIPYVIGTTDEVMPAHEVVVYTKWNAFSYNFTYYNTQGTAVSTEILKTGAALQINDGSYAQVSSGYYEFDYWTTFSSFDVNDYDEDDMPIEFTATKMLAKDVKLYPVYHWIEYKITWSVNGVTTDEYYHYNQTPTYPNAVSTLQKVDTYKEAYEFAGWEPSVGLVTTNKTYTAKYTATTKQYTYCFYNGEDVVKSVLTNADTVIVAPTDLADYSTVYFEYEFNNWYYDSDESGDIDASLDSAFEIGTTLKSNVNYYAIFDKTDRYYTVTWKDGDNAILYTESVKAGELASYDATHEVSGAPVGLPTKAESYGYEYTFNNEKWSYNLTQPILQDVIIIAGFDSLATTYSYHFYYNNGTNNLLYTSGEKFVGNDSYNAETIPFPEGTPTKADNAQYAYTFAGWYLDVDDSGDYSDGDTLFESTTVLSGNTGEDLVFYAKFDSTLQQYNITWIIDGASTIEPYEYGAMPSHTDPEKVDTAQYDYEFTGWSPEIVSVNGNAVYTAQFSQTTKQYTYNFYADSTMTGDPIKTLTVDYGTIIVAPTAPEKEAIAEYSYTFASWKNSTSGADDFVTGLIITEDVTYYATYTQTTNQYTYLFVNYDGITVSTDKVDYGSIIVAPETNPEKTGNAQYSYTFDKWIVDANENNQYDEGEIVFEDGLQIVGNITFTATYTQSVNKYTCTFHNEDEVYGTPFNADYGSLIVKPEVDPTKAATAKYSYTFDKWLDSDNQEVDFFQLSLVEDVNYYASYTSTPVEHTITFDSDQGSIVDSITKGYGLAVTAPTDPIKEGYSFNYWRLIDGTEEFEIPSTMPEYDISLVAVWTTENYTIAFTTNCDDTLENVEASYGDDITLPTSITKEGYYFDGWFNNIECEGAAISFTTVPDLGDGIVIYNLYAKWTIEHYTINFDTNDGTSVDSIAEDYGTAITLPTNSTKEGYYFDGWFDNEGLEGTAVTYTTMPDLGINNASITLYANWTKETYTLSFDKNEGIGDAEDIVAEYGDDITLPSGLTMEGYYFDGWFDNIDLSGTAVTYTTMPDLGDDSANVMLYAKWTKEQYTIAFVKDSEHGTVTGTAADIIAYYGDEITLPSGLTMEGYHFAYWCSDSDLSNHETSKVEYTTMPDLGENNATITLYAYWTTESYTIVFTTNCDATLENVSVAFGDDITLPSSLTKTGYYFDGWFDNTNCEGTAISFTTVPDLGDENGTYNLYAKWTIEHYTITFDKDGGVEEVPNISDDYNASISLVTPTKEGYYFDGWYSEDGTADNWGTELTSIMPDCGDNNCTVTYYAKWVKEEYTITFNVNDGIGNVEDIVAEYGEDIILPSELTMEGYYFDGWFVSETFEGVAVTYTTMPDLGADGDTITLNAKWTIEHYTINFDTNDGTSVDSIAEDYGTAITLPTTSTKEGYYFDGWYATEELDGEPVTYETMPDLGTNATSITLYANWTKETYTLLFDKNEGIGDAEDIVAEYGDDITLPNGLTMEGYYFDGWFDNIDLSGTAVTYTTMPDLGDDSASVMLYAKWTVEHYTITFDKDGGVEEVPNISDDYNASITLVTPTKEGYYFDGWYSEDGTADNWGTELTSIMPDCGDNNCTVTYYAKWVKEEYTIYFEANEGIGDADPLTAYYGDTIALPSELTREGHYFEGWFESDTFDGTAVTYTLMPDLGDNGDSITLNAKWTKETYTIAFDKNEGIGDATSITAGYGETISVPSELTKRGYDFINWNSSVDLDGSTLGTTMPDCGEDNCTVIYYAGWTATVYTITYNSIYSEFEVNANPAYYTIEETVEYSDPTIVEMTFEGWYTTDDYSTRTTGISLGSIGNVTVYANAYTTGLIFSEDGTTVLAYSGTSSEVYIPKNHIVNSQLVEITTIGDYAFDIENDYQSTTFSTIYMDNIKTINEGAFNYATSLTEIHMSSVETIETVAFYGCTGLTTLEMNSVVSIGSSAFYGCTNLYDVKLSNKLTNVDANAFRNTATNSSGLQITFDGTAAEYAGITIISTGNSILKNAQVNYLKQ